MLRVVTAPTSTLLLDPVEVRERLGLPEGEATAVERLVRRVSAIVAGQLRFEPWYQRLEERFDGDLGTDLTLSGRPFVRVVSVFARGDDEDLAVEGEDFDVRRTGRRSGEAYIHRPDGWEIISGDALAAAWTVNYWSGWWLPGMSGSKPADVLALPEDLAEAAWIVCQDRRAADKINPVISSMGKGSARIEFRRRAPGQVLPDEAEAILCRYAPVVG